ncbi:MAG: hypothetical protein ACE5HS_01550 [bacterium]
MNLASLGAMERYDGFLSYLHYSRETVYLDCPKAFWGVIPAKTGIHNAMEFIGKPLKAYRHDTGKINVFRHPWNASARKPGFAFSCLRRAPGVLVYNAFGVID